MHRLRLSFRRPRPNPDAVDRYADFAVDLVGLAEEELPCIDEEARRGRCCRHNTLRQFLTVLAYADDFGVPLADLARILREPAAGLWRAMRSAPEEFVEGRDYLIEP